MVCSLKLCKRLSNYRGGRKDIGCIPESSDERGWFGVKAVTHTSRGRGTREKEDGGGLGGSRSSFAVLLWATPFSPLGLCFPR